MDELSEADDHPHGSRDEGLRHDGAPDGSSGPHRGPVILNRRAAIAVASAAAITLLLAGCSPSSGTLTLLDGEGFTFCAPTAEDGSITHALNVAENTGQQTVISIEDVRLIDPVPGVTVLGAYFANHSSPRPVSGEAFDPTWTSDVVAPGDVADIAIGVSVDGTSEVDIPGAVITYRTDDGGTGSITTKVSLHIVQDSGEC